MSGRHRRTRTVTARRALVATVPALGLAGAVTAVSGVHPDVSSDAAASGSPLSTAPVSTTPVSGPALGPSALVVDDPAGTGAAADAARAAERVGERQRVEERRSIVAVVDDVRSQAEQRAAQAQADGREELAAFHRDVAARQAPDVRTTPSPRAPVDAVPRFGGGNDNGSDSYGSDSYGSDSYGSDSYGSDGGTTLDDGSDGDGNRCDRAGLPMFGERADPDEIVGRQCGLFDLFDHQRSSDRWIDGPLVSASGH